MRRLTTFALFCFGLFQFSQAQETYGIIPQGTNLPAKCMNCINTLNNMPPEVVMGFHVDEFNRIYFTMTDVDWFKQLFQKPTDGLAVDLIAKANFNCERSNSMYATDVSRGELLPPVYLKEMEGKMQVMPDGLVLVDMGLLPKDYRGIQYEMNLLLLNKKQLCYYNSFYNIKRYKWDLLDMGLYTDTVIYSHKDSSKKKSKTITSIQYKKQHFTVPFEKNQTQFTKADITPLYDSLSLNLYDIKRIKIRAYSSVEGSKANNIRLQESRAKSIVDALQQFQTATIAFDISSAENWVEFYQDIQGTSFANLDGLSKEEVKQKLSNKSFSADMEPILSKHRKAVIDIEIEKKTTFKQLTEEQIVSEFNKSLSNKDLETAQELMNLAFQRVIENKSPNSLLDQLEIPEQQEFGLLYNRKTVFQYFLDEEDLMATYNNFLELKKLDPRSKEINYNIIALKFKIWLSGSQEVKVEAFEKEIRALTSYGISTALVNRMLINYNIILSEINMFKRDYKAKDRNLKSIFLKYKSIKPDADELLSLAQYFVAYGKYDWATRLLKPHIGKVDADEDLLFYYINLTVIDRNTVSSGPYRKILLNAIDLNEGRFCQLFDSALMGGISFQLLDIPNLKKHYCESCN